MAEASGSLFPAPNSPQRQGGGSDNATGSSRNKVALPKGRSLMDWIRLGNSGTDLTGVGGRLIKVTPEELKKHNTKDDCWMAIGGVVYNISQYCEFHPGGIDEIMKGAGIDGTQQFNEVHRWVNYGSMLRKCIVGKLVMDSVFKRPPQYGNLLAPPRAMGTNLATVNKPQVAEPDRSLGASGPFVKLYSIEKPRYDYYQNDTAVKVSIYTRTPGICADNMVLERPDGNIKISLYTPEGKVYRLAVVPAHPLLLASKIKSVKKMGMIEIDFLKSERGLRWTRLGQFSPEHNTWVDRGPAEYIDCTVTSIERITHDTKLFTISLPEAVHMIVPTGHHVMMKADILGMDIERSYTPVCYLTEGETDQSEFTLEFIIKIYSDGALTQCLDTLKPGDLIPVSHHMGSFSMGRLESYGSVLMLAAGTGFTPMTKLIMGCLDIDKPTHFVYFSKTERDIFWREELDDLAKNRLFTVTHVLSQADSSWNGLAGRLTKDMLDTFLPAKAKSKTFIAACGPIPFIKLCKTLLSELEVGERQIHLFQE